MAHVVAESKEEAAEQRESEEDAENRTCAECYFPVTAGTRQIIIVAEKVAHNCDRPLEADVDTYGRLRGERALLNSEIVLSEVWRKEKLLAEPST